MSIIKQSKEELLKEFKKNKYLKLFIALVIDVLGVVASSALPILGEFTDLIFGPLSGLATFLMFRGKVGIFGGVFETIEEMVPIPLVDATPGVSIVWWVKYVMRKDKTFQKFLENKKKEGEILDEHTDDEELIEVN